MPDKIILQPGREKSVLRHHPWIFSHAIKEIEGSPEEGGEVEVFSSGMEWLAVAAYSPKSQITARIWSFDRNDTIDEAFFRNRISEADQRRESLRSSGITAYRVVAAESDGIPGLIIDRDNNFIVVQILSAGCEHHRNDIIGAISSLFPELSIYERSDVSVRKKEGLEEKTGLIRGEIPPDELVISETGGMKIIVDIVHGHKTGYYLDQRDNRAKAAMYAKGTSVLNCFCYTGGFSLFALRGGAKSVTNVDVSERALELSKKNIVLNHLDPGRVKFIREDVFAFLRKQKQKGEKYDLIVLDPPKFAENKSHLMRAARGYKDINMLAFSLLRKGGVLMTFSCSGLMTRELFQKVVADAAMDAGVNAQIVDTMSQACDHPVGLPYPEGLYLKGFAVRVMQ